MKSDLRTFADLIKRGQEDKRIQEELAQRRESLVFTVDELQKKILGESEIVSIFDTKIGSTVKRIHEEIAGVRRSVSNITPGGGAGSSIDLYRPTKTITSNYQITSSDYYIGCNHTELITLTLPAVRNGREYIIKDESGKAQLIPIRILGTIDNNTDGIELRINNGSLTLLYNNGWRLI